jgi:hypothetical protein
MYVMNKHVYFVGVITIRTLLPLVAFASVIQIGFEL